MFPLRFLELTSCNTASQIVHLLMNYIALAHFFSYQRKTKTREMIFSLVQTLIFRLALGQIIRRLEVNKKFICCGIVLWYSSATGDIVAARLKWPTPNVKSLLEKK